MHFLLTAIGSYGDVHPVVGLGAALRRRGHRVSVITNPYFADVVSQAGLELLSITTREHYLRLIAHPDVWHPIRSVPVLFREAIINLLDPLYRLIEENYVPGETVVVAHVLDAASRVFRETTGAPVALLTLTPQAMWSDHRPPHLGPRSIGPHMPRWINRVQFWLGNRWIIEPQLKRPLDRFRAQLGLPATPRLFPDWWFASDVNLCFFPDWFSAVQPDWPRPIETVGFPLWDAGDTTTLSPEVEAFLDAGEPPIAFTPGSANKQAESFFATAVEVCQQLGRRGILLTKFLEQVPADLPASIRHFEFLPLTRLLPRTAALVHHGGIGTCSQALAAAIPQLIRPLAFDQFDNSNRLQRLGVAAELRPGRFKPRQVVAALDRLTSCDQVHANCQHWAGRCDGPAAIAAACSMLERLATGRDVG